MQQTRKLGFTMVELLVVLAIAAVISSITFGAFRSISEGNRRSSCQANLSQIYQSCRLYAQDYNGKFPYLNPRTNATQYVAPVGTNTAPAADSTPPGGIGLWALYTYPKTGSGMVDSNCSYPHNNIDLPLPESDSSAPSLAGYVKNVRIFHCPADNFQRNIDYRINPTDTACTTTKVDSASLLFTSPSNQRRLNPSYLSYQTADDVVDTTTTPQPTAPINTYSSFRLNKEPKQLTYYSIDSASKTSTPERPVADGTVVTWCRFHRTTIEKNGEVTSQLNKRNFDIVLFSDGTVQSLPAQEDKDTFAACNAATVTCLTGWQRIPKRTQ